MTKSDDAENEKRRQEQATEIHAALGRYLEAFESVIMVLRMQCVFLTSMLSARGKNTQQQELMMVVFNSRSMTAENLLRIYEGLVGHIVNDKNTGISNEAKQALNGAFKTVNNSFKKMGENRNDYMHGTWIINEGRPPDADFTRPIFIRQKISRTGLVNVEGPPDFKAIDEYTEQCKFTKKLFLAFSSCLITEVVTIPLTKGTVFKVFRPTSRKKDAPWELIPPQQRSRNRKRSPEPI